MGQKLNLSWVDLCVASFSVNRKAVKWSFVKVFSVIVKVVRSFFTIGVNLHYTQRYHPFPKQFHFLVQ